MERFNIKIIKKNRQTKHKDSLRVYQKSILLKIRLFIQINGLHLINKSHFFIILTSLFTFKKY